MKSKYIKVDHCIKNEFEKLIGHVMKDDLINSITIVD